MNDLDFKNDKAMRSELWALTKMMLKFYWFYMVYVIRDLYEHFRNPVYGIQKRSRELQKSTTSEQPEDPNKANDKLLGTGTNRPNYIRRVK